MKYQALFFQKIKKMSQNVSHAAVMNGAIRDKSKRREPSLHTSNYRAI